MKQSIACLALFLGLAAQGFPAETKAPEAARRRIAYVSNLMSHTLSVVDLDGSGDFHNVEIGRYPIFSALHPTDPAKLVVALHNYERTENDDGLVLVDLRKEKVLKKVPFPGAGMPSGFVHDAKRNRIYVADENLNRVFVLDGITLDPIFDFPAGLIPVHVDLSPDGRWLVATNRKSADLYVYDLDDIQHDAKNGIYSIHLGRTPGPDWDAAEPGAPSCHPVDVKFGADPALCYVTDFDGKQLLCVDIRKREVVGRVAFAHAPFDLALNREKTLAYVCHVDGESVSVVDLARREVVREIAGLATNPIHCVVDDERDQLVVGCWGGTREGGIYLVDLKTFQVLRRFPLTGAAASIGITVARRP